MEPMIQRLQAGHELTPAEIREAAAALLGTTVPDETKGELLAALSRKGETPAEISGFVEEFLVHAVDPRVDLADLQGPTIDVCGTGGDKLGLFNVSTTAMFVVAAAGGVVVKHGNRGITSPSGGADVLEALGVRIDLPPDGFRRCLARAGVGFMFAPLYHPAFKAVVNVRKALAARGVRTIFNLMGPLLNPARPDCQLTGVFAGEWCPAFAEILRRLGRKSAWVVHGTTADGRAVDEVSLMGPTRVCASGGTTGEWTIHPEAYGLRPASPADLTGGDAHANAAILTAILSGDDTGPKRDMVLLNAGAALACAGLAADLRGGIALAREALASGAAHERLRLLREATSA